jgi:ubiquinone/menaquinone biosynthesis C-methylase UbiE
MAEITKQQIDAGQAVYTKLTLAMYDLWVIGISNHFIWQCPSSYLLDFYNQHISGNHLDIGVGTGFFLDKCIFPIPNPRIVLMDLNPDSLEVTSRRVSRYNPVPYKVNILDPINLNLQGFDSVGLNYLLHCLPGTITTKSVVFKNLFPLLNPGGVIFGSTILNTGVKPSFIAQNFMNFYNRVQIFDNKNDSLEELKKIMSENFAEYSVKVMGCVALFWGRVL